MVAIVLMLVIADLVTAANADTAGFLIWPVMFGPLPVGIALVAGRSPPTRYAFGCGVLIGWPIALIVSSGLCIGGVITPFRLAG